VRRTLRLRPAADGAQLCGVDVERPQRNRDIRHPRSSVNRRTAGRHILRAGILPGDRRSRDCRRVPGDRPVGDRLRDGRPGLRRVPAQVAAGLEQPFPVRGLRRNCGSVTSTSVNPVDAAEALGLGYAVVNTDTGHEQDPATILLTWAVSDSTPPVVNASAIIDFYYRAVHQVTVAAKQYVEAYYSGPIDHAYFDGCSTGGRQSMVEGTRYPVDYDGLIVGDPAIAAHTGSLSTLKQGLAFVPPAPIFPCPQCRPSTRRCLRAAMRSTV